MCRAPSRGARHFRATDSSGEIEPVIVAMTDGLWLTIGSDHTDRKAEAQGVALSKQLCAKPVGKDLWRLDEVVGHQLAETGDVSGVDALVAAPHCR